MLRSSHTVWPTPPTLKQQQQQPTTNQPTSQPTNQHTYIQTNEKRKEKKKKKLLKTTTTTKSNDDNPPACCRLKCSSEWCKMENALCMLYIASKRCTPKKGGGGWGWGFPCVTGWLWPWPVTLIFFFWHGATLCSACSSIFEQPPPPPRGLHLHDNYGDYANVYPRCYDDDLDNFSGSADTSPHSDYILSESEYRYGIFEQLYVCVTIVHNDYAFSAFCKLCKVVGEHLHFWSTQKGSALGYSMLIARKVRVISV